MTKMKEHTEGTLIFTISPDLVSYNFIMKEAIRYTESLGYNDNSNLYIVLRELILSSILHEDQVTRLMICSLNEAGDGMFRVTVDDGCGGASYWFMHTHFANLADTVHFRSRYLLMKISEFIEADHDTGTVTVSVAVSRGKGFHGHVYAI